jgi:hypothetical protein
MNTFNRKALTAAVLAGLGVAGTAHAVYNDPNGLGQSLIYPYYTVQSNAATGTANNTYINVVNTTAQAKVVKVRFREGKASFEVLDFNLYLSPFDVWTAVLIPADATATGSTRLITSDKSCTNPAIPAIGVDFRNFAYAGDGLGDGLDRTREGYAEMIEMAVIIGSAAAAATHAAATGAPTCTGLTGTTVGGATGQVSVGNRTLPTGGLMGSGTLINVVAGSDVGYKSTALSNVTAVEIYSEIGTELGNFTNAVAASTVVANNNVYLSSWSAIGGVAAGVHAVSSTMMHTTAINEYVLDSATRSNSDWVVTFPTKWYYYPTPTPVTPFTAVLGDNGACESVAVTFFNREEAGAVASGADFSPRPPGAPGSSLCWESTVVSWRNGTAAMPTGTTSGPLASVNTAVINVTSGFQAGWAAILFNGTNASVTGLVSDATSISINLGTLAVTTAAQTYFGLPQVGFLVRSFVNGAVPAIPPATGTVLSSYSSAFDHSFRQRITP